MHRMWSKFHIHFTAPPKRHYVHFFHDGRRLRQIKKRWMVERTNSWLRAHKRIECRYDVYTENYLGFVLLSCFAVLIKKAVPI